jgi:uncharacterized membrane protein YagU involved in acid resistance
MFTLAATIIAIGFALIWALVFTMLGDAWPRLLLALRGAPLPPACPALQPALTSRRFSRV